MQRKKKISVAALCGLLAAGVVAGTMAYWNQTATIENPFDTGKYGSETVEPFFIPPDIFEPGVEVDKDVLVKNTGNVDMIVRAKLSETWTRKGETAAYKDSVKEGFDVYSTNQVNPTDGLTAADGSVVTKKFSTSTNWIKGNDGWYYYRTNLAGGASTDIWLDAVELLDNADIGNFETLYYVSSTPASVPEAQWVWYPYDSSKDMPKYIDANGNPVEKGTPGAQQVLRNKAVTKYKSDNVKGYSDSDYVLTVTTQTVQASQEALDAVFGGGSTFTAPSGTSWVLADKT